MEIKEEKTKKPKKNTYQKVNHAHEPRSRFIKRILMYTAFAVLTVCLSILVFYRAKGYTFTKNGQVEKRGIVLINSAPISSRVLIDGKDTGKRTDYKLEISEGKHTLKLEADGYRTWQTDFTIKSQQVEWFYYPYLITNNILEEPLSSAVNTRTYSSLSSDNEIVSAYKPGEGNAQVFTLELLKLKDSDPIKTASQIVVPTQLFTRAQNGTLGNLSFDSWSPNGDSIFMGYDLYGKKEVINLRINAPEESKNLTNTLGDGIIEYRYDDSSKLHILRNGELATYDPKSLQKESITETQVASFNTFQDSKQVYTKQSASGAANSLDIFMKDGANPSKKITTINNVSAQDLDFQYTTNRRIDYLSISNRSAKELLIYKNPLDSQVPPEPLFLSTFKSLISNQIQQSPSGSPQPGTYISLQLSEGSIFIYDFEREESITYDLSEPLSGQAIVSLAWIDSERLQAKTSDGTVYYFDYDGNYVSKITKTDQPLSYFVRGEDKTIIINSVSGTYQGINQIKFKK